MGLEIELSRAADVLRRCNPTSISLSAGCELFMRCVVFLTTVLWRAPSRACALSKTACVQLCDAHHVAGSRRPGAVQSLADRERQHLCGDVAESACQDSGARGVLYSRRQRAADARQLACRAGAAQASSRAGKTLQRRGAPAAGMLRACLQLISRCPQVTEGRPDSTGPHTARLLAEAGVPVRVAYCTMHSARPEWSLAGDTGARLCSCVHDGARGHGARTPYHAWLLADRARDGLTIMRTPRLSSAPRAWLRAAV